MVDTGLRSAASRSLLFNMVAVEQGTRGFIAVRSRPKRERVVAVGMGEGKRDRRRRGE